MITNFESYTIDITDEEVAMADLLIKSLHKHPPGTIWTSSQIIAGFRRNGYQCTSPRVRKIVAYIRSKSIAPLLASSNGYYLSKDSLEIKKHIKSLQQRIAGIQIAIDGLKAFV